jgi:RNA polymerase sigma-70 factor (ECF subfamily)
LEDGQLLRSLLQELPAEQQQIIALAYYGGMSHSELAQHLGLPLDIAKNRLQSGMETLLTLWRQACASPPEGQSLANRRRESDGE